MHLPALRIRQPASENQRACGKLRSNHASRCLQVCGKPVTTATGKCLSPPGNSRVILYLKDINLPQ
jgi:hypothetical protein